MGAEEEISNLSNAAVCTKPHKKKGLNPKKKNFIETFIKTLNISATCRKTGIPRRTFYYWMEHDAEFRFQFEDLNEYKKDWYIERFDKLCDAGNPQAVIKAVTSFCKDRGYGDSQETTIKTDQPVIIKHIRVPAPSELEEKDGETESS